MTLTEILETISDHVRHELDIATFVAVPNGSSELPLLGFLPGSVQYQRTAGALATFDVDVWLLLKATDMEYALNEAFCWQDPSKLVQLIEKCPGIPNASLHVSSASPPIDADLGGTPVLAINFTLEVHL